jgi:hypothetical protein
MRVEPSSLHGVPDLTPGRQHRIGQHPSVTPPYCDRGPDGERHTGLNPNERDEFFSLLTRRHRILEAHLR